MQPQSVQLLAVLAIFGGFALAELRQGEFFPPAATPGDRRIDLAMLLMVPLISGAIFVATNLLCRWLIPQHAQALAGWPWWQMTLVLLVADDFTQYLWHRASHTSALWPLHRAHHSAAYMGVRVVYRNNIFYYLLMPGLWLGGVLLYLGFGWVFVGYGIVKLAVIIGAHSTVRWDQWLYRSRALAPLAWLLEHTISTPATHFAHHALVQDDGIGHYTGNYGNLLFVWDILFGSAHFSRQYPLAYGLADDRRHRQEEWRTQLAWPLRRSNRADSVLGRERHTPPA